MKLICRECDWQGQSEDMLKGKHPFKDEEIAGCPECHSVESTVAACEYEGCWRETSNGAPWPDGVYRWTCSDHSLWRQEKTAGVRPNWPDPIPRNNQQEQKPAPQTYTEVCLNEKCPRGGLPVEIVVQQSEKP